MRTFLYRGGAALFSAAAIIGLLTVTGAPFTLRREIVTALAIGVAVQMYIAWYTRRTSARG